MTTRILDILMAAGAALAVLLGSFGAFARECDEIPQEVLRLHIPANSDSEYDQAVKLKVRDYILEEYGAQLSGCGSREEAVEEVRRLLPDIEKSCCEYLSQQGADYGARAELTEMYFTTREYENVTQGDWVDKANQIATRYNDVDVMVLNELESLFSCLLTVSMQGY